MVFALLPWGGQGGLAEYAVCEPEYLARIPEWRDPILRSRRFEHAATLPRAALTAWQALKVELGGVLKPGMSRLSPEIDQGRHKVYSKILTLQLDVLITGATGVVGRLAVQLARDIIGLKREVPGAKIIAYGGKQQPSDTFADVHIERDGHNDWTSRVPKDVEIDVVFDTIGGMVMEESLIFAKEGGVVVTIGTPIPVPDELKAKGLIKKGVKFHFFVVAESGSQLREIAEMVQDGKMIPTIAAVADKMTEKSVRDTWGLYDTSTKSLNGGLVIKVSDSLETVS